ncbi:MAG: hypothetical protein ACWGOV_02270 [Acidiferrobacterales bacterium]
MDFFGFTFVMFIGAAGVLLGYLILLFIAFTTSAAWGIGSLLVPPVALAFAVSHWGKAKNGFAIVMIGVIIFAYGNWDRNQATKSQAKQVVEETTTQPAQEPIAPVNNVTPGNSQTTPQPEPTAPVAPAPPPPASTAPAPQDSSTGTDKPVMINIIDAHKYINHEVRVTTDSGDVRIGTLLEVNDKGIVIDYIVTGATGRVRAEISEDQIHLIELLQ